MGSVFVPNAAEFSLSATTATCSEYSEVGEFGHCQTRNRVTLPVNERFNFSTVRLHSTGCLDIQCK